MLNSNWTRWINASVAIYIKNITDTLNLPLLFEGIDERDYENIQHSHAELRIGGPFVKEVSKNYWNIRVDINILLTYFMQADENNVYKLQTYCGKLQEAMNGPIDIYKYGGEVGDDESYVGCLRPIIGKFEANRVLQFGQISRVDRIRQAMIDGRYYMYLDS